MTTQNEAILFTHENGIARIRLNRPSVLNALDAPMADAILAACKALQSMDGIRVVVLSGEGRSFMAGGDLARFHADMPQAGQTAMHIIGPLHEALTILAALPQPVLASLHGPVAGAGVSIALACDLAIAAADTTFNLAYARVGTSPDGSSSWTLPRIVGLRKALEIALLSETIDADEALRLGLINRLVSGEALATQTEEMAQRLASGPTFAYGQIKRLMRNSFAHSMQQQMDGERDAFVSCTGSEDFQEGVAAFFQRRPPIFRGS